MLRFLKRILLATGFIVMLAMAVHLFAAWRVREGLLAAGMSDPVASCMTKRMVKRLNVVQLARLQNLEGDKPTPREWIHAVKEVSDSEVILVTASSAALCKTGLAR